WVKLPGMHFQPSEWVKLILILAVAKYFADLQQRELSWPEFIKAGAIVGVPMLMVLRQPDLGTALTYLPIAVIGSFLGGVRLTQNAQTAPDRAGTFVVMGVVAVLSFHILVNVGMVVGFMPVTGIPLPLMSYGGSSVLFMFLALGMVMNVRMRRFVN